MSLVNNCPGDCGTGVPPTGKDDLPSDKQEVSGQCHLRRRQKGALVMAVAEALPWDAGLTGCTHAPCWEDWGTAGGFAQFYLLPEAHLQEGVNSPNLAICFEGTF